MPAGPRSPRSGTNRNRPTGGARVEEPPPYLPPGRSLLQPLPSRDPAGRPLVAQEGPRNGRASRVPGIPHGSAGLIQPLIDEKCRQTENHLPESEAATLDRAPASATKVVSECFVAVGRAEPPDCIEAPPLHQASRHKIRVACRVHATWVAVPKELREGDRGGRVFQPAFFHGDISVCACWPAGRDRMFPAIISPPVPHSASARIRSPRGGPS